MAAKLDSMHCRRRNHVFVGVERMSCWGRNTALSRSKRCVVRVESICCRGRNHELSGSKARSVGVERTHCPDINIATGSFIAEKLRSKALEDQARSLEKDLRRKEAALRRERLGVELGATQVPQSLALQSAGSRTVLKPKVYTSRWAFAPLRRWVTVVADVRSVSCSARSRLSATPLAAPRNSLGVCLRICYAVPGTERGSLCARAVPCGTEIE
eukprot:1872048-Rhodomonas_salina.1